MSCVEVAAVSHGKVDKFDGETVTQRQDDEDPRLCNPSVH